MNELELLPLFAKFIKDSHTGRRLKKDGKRIKPQTIVNYKSVYRNLLGFSSKRNFPLRIALIKGNNKKLLQTERNYWKKFYKGFTDYLYTDRECFDNYVGTNIKIIKTFFRYLIQEKSIRIGDFFRSFHMPQEEVPIITLSPDQLRFLIHDRAFEDRLAPHLRVSKDIFVFGCTVALRVSDIFRLQPSNVQSIDGKYFLSVRARKTGVEMRVKLPDYAYAILQKYPKGKKNKTIFPPLSLNQFNNNIRRVAEEAGWNHPVGKARERQGLYEKQYRDIRSKDEYRFCDLITSHTMRRTAITTMLIYGMPEHLVKLISGHAGNSKAFYRYVSYVQSFADMELDKVHEKMGKYDT
jgi:integrase